MNFTRFIISMDKLKAKRDKILADPQTKENSQTFAVRGIVFSIVTIILSVAGGFLFRFGTQNDSLVMILCFVFGAVLLLGAIGVIINAFIRVGFQLSVNKLPIGYAALAVSILSLLASVAAAILLVVMT